MIAKHLGGHDDQQTDLLGGIASGAAAIAAPHVARAQEVKHYRFAYDQPKPTGYGIVGDIFANRLKELSKGTMLIDQYPGAQLGQEPQVLQLVKSGDIEFCISSSANAATVSPQAGVMSLHYLFRSEDHLVKAMADPKLSEACKAMIADSVQGARIIALSTLGLRNMYSKREIRKIEDIKGLKVRVQATPTEDTMFPAYGAQTVHMPFGSVYTSLQTGVVDVAENGVNVYLANKHYEVAPGALDDGARGEQQLHLGQRQIVEQPFFRAEELGAGAPPTRSIGTSRPKAVALEHESATKLKSIGVKIVSDVDKSGFQKIADPYLDKMSADLGPHATKIKDLIRAIA